jgi:hypothetical protein
MQHLKRTRKISTTDSSSALRAVVACAVLALLAALATAGCGGGAAAPVARHATRPSLRVDRKAGAPKAVPVRPIEIVVLPKRAGGSLEVAIEVTGRGHQEGEAFEDPDGWEIVARDFHGQELRRIMNGPGRVEREPVGNEDGSQWDVVVTHSVYFALPANVSKVAVRVAVPAASPVEIQSELL